MSGDFFDSNVLLYVFDETERSKQATAQQLVGQALEEHSASISFQVVQESLSVLSRRFSVTATPEDARKFLDEVLVPLWDVMPTQQLYVRALEIQERYGFHFYDALIVAAALTSGCSRLLSEDLQDGQRIEGLTIVNPFK